MTFKIDLHVHSRFSGDSSAEPEHTVLMAIEKGLNGIAFTEHYSYGASEFAERLKEKYSNEITIFRGVEFSAFEGHCLIFGVDTDGLLTKHALMEEVISVVKEKGGIVIPSHPYRGANSVGERIWSINGIAAVEGYNGYNMHSFNMMAVEAADILGIPYTGGSDAHSPEDVGACYTEFFERVTGYNVIDLLKQGGYRGVDMRKISKMGWF